MATFRSLCEQAEQIEKIPEPPITASNAGSMYAPPADEEPSTTTTAQTTMNPNTLNLRSSLLYMNSNQSFRLTIPISLTLFAVVDCIGYLSGANNNALKTNENFKEFFKQSKEPVSEDDSEFLNQVFRQGLTHIYFPKLHLGISYHSTNPKKKLFFKSADQNLVLNVNRLEEIVVSTFDDIKGNASLYPLMETRYVTMIGGYQTAYGGKIAAEALKSDQS